MAKMNPQIKKKWVDRLRELPNHRQGKNALRRNNKMCCLGVLCEIAVQEGILKRSPKNYGGFYHYGQGRLSLVLPEEVIKWANLEAHNNNPVVKNNTLSTYNDHKGKNFDEIADLIEKHL